MQPFTARDRQSAARPDRVSAVLVRSAAHMPMVALQSRCAHMFDHFSPCAEYNLHAVSVLFSVLDYVLLDGGQLLVLLHQFDGDLLHSAHTRYDILRCFARNLSGAPCRGWRGDDIGVYARH